MLYQEHFRDCFCHLALPAQQTKKSRVTNQIPLKILNLKNKEFWLVEFL